MLLVRPPKEYKKCIVLLCFRFYYGTMKLELIVVRHAVAENRDEFNKTGLPDSKRPLTEKGIKKFRKISEWLATQTGTIDLLCESPLTRSQQTVDILATDLIHKKRLVLAELDPTHPPETLCKKLDSLKWKRVVICGHEPHLSHLMCYMTGISVKHYAEFELKKGGMASFIIKEPLLEKRAKLQWLVTPRLILSSK